MVLSSYDEKDFFPNNTSHNFFVKLNRALQFDGYWVVALTEIGTSERAQKDEFVVYSDICQDSFVGSSEQPLLRRIFYEDVNDKNIIYVNPYYVPVNLKDIQQIYIYIKDENGNEASFLKKKVTVALHLKKIPLCIVKM
jgi:hypothetical protein